MRIILFQGGARGELVSLPGERPEAELAELLEGEAEMTHLSRRYILVTRKDGEENRLTIRYSLHRLGREPEPIAGDCAVVVASPEGHLRDAGPGDLKTALSYIGEVG